MTPALQPEIMIIEDMDDEKSHDESSEDIDVDISEDISTGSSTKDAAINTVANDIVPIVSGAMVDDIVADVVILDNTGLDDVTEHSDDDMKSNRLGSKARDNVMKNTAEQHKATSDDSLIRTHINPYHRLILSQRRKDIEKVSPCSNLLTLVNSLTKSIKEARGSLDITKQLFGGKNVSEKQVTQVVNAADVANGSKQLPNHYTNTVPTHTGSATMSIDDDSELEPPPSQVSSIEYTYYLRFPSSLSPSPPPVAQLLSPTPPAENPLVSTRIRTLWDDIMAHYYDSDSLNTDTESLIRPYAAIASTLPGKDWEQQVQVRIPRSAMIPYRSGRTRSLTEKTVQAESQWAQALAKRRQRAEIALRTCKR